MIFTDSHCHLTMSDAAANLEAASAAGVRGFIVPATNLEDAPSAIAIAQASEGVWAAVGFHPHEAKDCDAAAFSEIERMLREQKVVAVGEVGLDYHYLHSTREQQREVFLRHLALAKANDLPLIIHNRESTDDLLELLTGSDGDGARGVLHSYTESREVALRLIERGYFISFSGIVTFRNAEALREVARALPLDRILIETDTPYLAPVPHRGQQNQPAYVVRVAEVLATLHGVPLDEVARVTTANFERAFSVRVS